MTKLFVLSFRVFAGIAFSSLLLTSAQAQTKIDYSEFDRLTRKYVDEQGLVDYRGLKTELPALKQFVDQLAAVSPERRFDGRSDCR